MKSFMDKKIEVYVDTSAFIAFIDRSDTYHSLFHRLFADPPQLITTTLVIAEGHGWFLKRYDQNRALEFLNMVDVMEPLKIASVGQQEQKSAMEILRKYPDQPLTLADAVGLHIMGSRGIKRCWSTDRHLGLTGVSLVIYQ